MELFEEDVMTKYFAALLMLFVAWPTLAADLNGYTAKYECKAGGTNCNVDVDTLANQACQQTITATASWSTINWSNNVICIAAGDHRAKGVLTLGSSGTAGTRKVLRYYRSSDANDEPWNQSTGNQAILHSIDATGRDYWVIHRITIDRNETAPSGGGRVGIQLGQTSKSEHNIISHVLIQRLDGTGVSIDAYSTGNVIQNSIIRSLVPYPNGQWTEHMCIDFSRSTNTYVVNNELYDCDKSVSAGDGSFVVGGIIENNDMYLSPAARTDCSGNYTPTGDCSGNMEAQISLKSSGIKGNPVQIIHNRFWGCRWGDSNVSQSGDCPAISISANNQGGNASYVLVQNNIIFDQELGIWNYHGTGTCSNQSPCPNPHHATIIGNLIYNIHKARPSHPQEPDAALIYRDLDNSEIYLNTVIDSSYWLVTQGYGTDNDVRCNVAINTGGQSGDIGSGTQVDNNAFYATPKFTTNSQGLNITKPNVSDAANVEYCFYRKLRTGSERICVPNARTTTASPHYQACNTAPGTRTGIGISDSPLF
jgi:hypothetical protein